jgi:hypothetical protein
MERKACVICYSNNLNVEIHNNYDNPEIKHFDTSFILRDNREYIES